MGGQSTLPDQRAEARAEPGSGSRSRRLRILAARQLAESLRAFLGWTSQRILQRVFVALKKCWGT